MARKKRITTVEEVGPEDEQPVLADLETAGDDPLDDVLAELADQVASFTVFRLPAIGQPGKRAFCATYRADDLGGQGIMEFVAERWGGGRYLLSPRGEGGAILKNHTIEIDRSVKPKAEPVDAPPRDNRSELVELVREVIRDSRGNGNGMPPDITAAIVQSASAQAAAMMGMLQPLLTQIMQMAKPNTPPWETLTPMLTAALEIGAEARGGGGGDGPASYLPLVEKFANILDNATKAGRVPGQSPTPPSVKEVPPVTPVNPNEPGWIKGLRPYLPGVLAAASADVPPEMVLDQLEQRAPRMLDWLSERDPETWPGEVAAFAPELTPHVGWIKRLLETIQADDAEEPAGLEGGAEL